MIVDVVTDCIYEIIIRPLEAYATLLVIVAMGAKHNEHLELHVIDTSLLKQFIKRHLC